MDMLRRTAATGFLLCLSASAAANPWEVREGSTLLDGTETATYVAGHMFLGRDYEVTASQVSLRCVEEVLVMSVTGDGDLLSRSAAQDDPTVEIMVKIGDELRTFAATLPNATWGRERARVHDGPGLLAFLRRNDGGSARVQLPVARTGVPEVRTLSLERVAETTDLILATCGPMKTWEREADTDPQPGTGPFADGPQADPETNLQIGVAKAMVERLIRDRGVTIERIVEALEPLAD